jgi:hypothetical protein
MTTTKRVAVRVRGIYATALTAVLLDQGLAIAQPSVAIRERFAFAETPDEGDVSVTDRRDRQGVLLRGAPEALTEVRAALESALPHALFAPSRGGDGGLEAEFPATVKEALDRQRAAVLPTLPGHHRLKTIDADAVDTAETDLGADHTSGEALVKALFDELVSSHLRPRTPYEVDHVKAGERVVQTRATIREHRRGTIELARQFRPGGRYDSLAEPILPGDTGTMTLTEGSWVVRRQYFRADGTLIGELHNINTPVELYADHARYVDLEVDVAVWPPHRVSVVDKAELDRKVAGRLIPEALAAEALRRAEELAAMLRR